MVGYIAMKIIRPKLSTSNQSHATKKCLKQTFY